MRFMSKRNIEKYLLKKANEIDVPDVRGSVLRTYGYEKPLPSVRRKAGLSKWWYSLPVFLGAMAIICFSIVGSKGYILFHEEEKEYTEVKDLDKIQSIYAYQSAVLTTLLNNPESINESNAELTNALSDSVGFMDLIMNMNTADVSLFQCKNKEYDYYLQTNLGEDEYCRFYYNEQSFMNENALQTTILDGYLEIGHSEFNVFGHSKIQENGLYAIDLMLGYNDESMVCISSDEAVKNMYEYRLYNKKSIVKTVNLRFNETGVIMSVDVLDRLYSFDLHGSDDHFSGDYYTNQQSGSVWVDINSDTYSFHVDDKQTTAERYIMP